MKATLQVGITGGIGSGKSLVCKIFACLGIPIYDADYRAKALMTTDTILVSQIRKEFGDLSYGEDGNLNRSFLADSVFGDPDKLEKLNSLVHPRVGVDYSKWFESVRSVAPYVIKEAALLFEAGSNRQLDAIIVVTAPVETRVGRVLQRDKHRTSAQVKDIISRQLPDDEKIRRADFVVTNDESTLLISQVLSLHKKFLEK